MKIYYSHRYGGQRANLARAKERFTKLQDALGPSHTLVAPWIGLAELGTPEWKVWERIREEIATCDVVFLDRDGKPTSDGMFKEKRLAVCSVIVTVEHLAMLLQMDEIDEALS